MTQDGSSSRPWSTLEAVFAANKTFAPGDTLLVYDGYHGAPVIKGLNSGTVTIQPAAGVAPRLRKLTFTNASRWTVLGLDISPLHAGASSYDTSKHVDMQGSCSYLTVRDCRIRSVFSVADWTLTEWTSRLGLAVSCGAPYSTITGNRIENVGGGIHVGGSAPYSVVAYNVIDTIRDDGFRGLANHCRFEYNTLTNMYSVDSNHDDAFQSWSNGAGGIGSGVVLGVVVRGNIFISYTDPNQPYKTAMQGIGLFDGMFENWVIENNVIVTDQWHGIAIYGATNCRIVNNTVVKNPVNARSNTPWIQISAHKNGTASTGNIVRNNITPKLNVSSTSASLSHNLVSMDYAALFIDWAGFDLELKATCLADGGGTALDAPTTDALLRTRSLPYDLGAYERVTTVAPAIVAAPTATMPSGSYSAPLTVELTSATADAVIRYTLDGSTPSSENGSDYTGPLTLETDTVLQAVAFVNSSMSSVSRYDYAIEIAPPPPPPPPSAVTVAFEAEALSRTTVGATSAVLANSGASGRSLVQLQATGTGQRVILTTGTVQAGQYTVRVYFEGTDYAGEFSSSVNGMEVGGSYDQFSRKPAFSYVDLGAITVAESGAQQVALTVTGKRKPSRGYYLTVDRIVFAAQP